MIEELKAIIDTNLPLTTNLANASACLNLLPDLNWCGFYLVKGESLYLGPFQGEVACTVIKKGHGVCGTAFLEKRSIKVDDVTKFAGHIACSSKSKAELVTPIFNKMGDVVGVIDLDAPILNRFTERDVALLEEVSRILSPLFD